MRTRIVYEDEQVLVCYKPAGLATQTARVGQADMVSELKNYLAGKVRMRSAGESKTPVKSSAKAPYLGVIHRLDQPVEGLLVFAKNPAAAAALTAQLGKEADGTPGLHKKYYAVTAGETVKEKGTLVDSLCKDDKAGVTRVVTGQEKEYSESKRAVLHYEVKESRQIRTSGEAAAGKDAKIRKLTMVDINIETGRFHQIRAQMAHAGLALLGDQKYADPETIRCGTVLGVRTVALCAYEVAFCHPKTKELLEFKIRPEGQAFQLFEEADGSKPE